MVNLSSARRSARQAVFLAAALMLSPAQLHAETLSEALATAISNSPDLDVQRAALRGLDEGVAQARAGYRPTITGTGSAGANYSDSSESVKSTQRLPLTIGATVSQSIYDGGQTSNAVDGALASVKSGRFALLDTEQNVLLNAVTAYARVIEAQQNVRLAQNNLAVTRRTYQAARDRYEVGEVTRTDVAQAEAAVAESQANLSLQQGLLGQRRQDYIRFVGVAPGNLEKLPALPELPKTVSEANSVAEENHPSILAAKANVEAAAFAVREAIGATLPQVDLTGSVSGAANTVNRNSGVLTSSAAVEVTVPFYQGGALRSRVRQAQASASQARAQLTLTTRQVMQEVGIAWENLQAARSSIRSNQAQVRAQSVAFEGVSEEAKVGSRTTLDVLEAEQDLLDARVALVGSQTDLYLNGYSLLASTGVLTVSKLGVDAQTYDYATPYVESQKFDASYPDTEDTDWQRNWRP